MDNLKNKRFISGLLGAAVCINVFTAVPAFADDKIIMGDLNGDNTVDALDASDILSYYALNSTLQPTDWSEERIKACDIDGDGEVLATDATWVLMYYAYLSSGGTVDNIRTYKESVDIIESVDFDFNNADLSVEEIYDKSTKEITLKWKAVEGATGYAVNFWSYGTNQDSNMNIESTVDSTEYKVILPDDIKNTEIHYMYSIRPYVDVQDLHKEASYWINDYLNAFRIIVNDAEVTPHDSYHLYNIKGDKPYYSTTYYVTADDKRILDEFAAENFTPDMTNYDKLECAWEWLNKNVTYAAGDLYNKISPYSWVRACFTEKMGQCLQYNGALAELLAYMGYDVYMLEMWLDKENQDNQHFRAEVNIEGQAYSIEVGNDGLYPGWMWFFTPIDSSIKDIE